MTQKIYTKTGDKGKTCLIGGKRVDKDCPRIWAYGHIDELNAVLGLCRAENDNPLLEKILRQLQSELFILGADLATPCVPTAGAKKVAKKPRKAALPRIASKNTIRLEKWIDGIAKELSGLKNFILPAGSDGACFLHLARTVCRRAERAVVTLAKHEKINPEIVAYLNRLSDLLFTMARFANKSEKIKEEKNVF